MVSENKQASENKQVTAAPHHCPGRPVDADTVEWPDTRSRPFNHGWAERWSRWAACCLAQPVARLSAHKAGGAADATAAAAPQLLNEPPTMLTAWLGGWWLAAAPEGEQPPATVLAPWPRVHLLR